MSKGHSYQHLLSLNEEALKALYPKGADLLSNQRWIAAQKRSHGPTYRSLARLLRDKRDLIEAPNIMKPGSGYTKDPKFGLGKHSRHAGEFGEAEPEAVDPATQRRFSADAKDRDSGAEVTVSMARLEGERQSLRGQLDTYRRLAEARGMDIRSDIRVVERRLEELDRKLGVRRAA